VTRAIRMTCAIALAVVSGAPVSAQTASTSRRVTITKTAFGAPISVSELALTDMLAHKLVQSFRIDRGRSSDRDFDVAEEHIYAQEDMVPGKTQYKGYSRYLMQNGDTVYFSWEGAPVPTRPDATADDAVGAGTMQITRGTGRYIAIRGTGTWRGYENRPVLEENVWDIVY